MTRNVFDFGILGPHQQYKLVAASPQPLPLLHFYPFTPTRDVNSQLLGVWGTHFGGKNNKSCFKTKIENRFLVPGKFITLELVWGSNHSFLSQNSSHQNEDMFSWYLLSFFPTPPSIHQRTLPRKSFFLSFLFFTTIIFRPKSYKSTSGNLLVLNCNVYTCPLPLLILR